MSYIYIDAEAARRCAALIREQSDRLRGLLTGTPDPKLVAFCQKLDALGADLSAVTEAYAAEDERLKAIHHMTGEGGRLNNGQ